MSCGVLLIANDNLVQLTGLKDEKTGLYQSGATVQATVKDRAGNNVSGQTWPLTLNYIVGSNGNYDGILEDTLSLKENQKYVVEIVATLAGGTKYSVNKQVTAITRDN